VPTASEAATAMETPEAATRMAEAADMGDTHAVGETATPEMGDIYAAVGEDLGGQGRQLASGTPLLAEVPAGVMMQVPDAFAPSMGRLLPSLIRRPRLAREGIERHWGPLDPPSVGATTRDEHGRSAGT
jgi:hypothetical protein